METTNESEDSGPMMIGSQDPMSPFFLTSSDNPGNVLVSQLMNNINYPRWKRAMTTALRAKNKFSFVYGSITKPTSDEGRELHVWNKYNSMVISWIINSLIPKLHDSVAYLHNAHELWKDLEERFSQGNAPRVHELRRELALTKQGDQSVSSYFTQLRGLWDELGTYRKAKDCTCGAAKDQLEERE
ncbi:uncharacterized protein LOC116131766 [Pistacia vera]|uniref:uncharacterized protein LOC116131766 n=1 Tax=Pistacia vera TaxID=55513 RepID=UPI0012635D36|nr:uncharacterized protein LOC116131766 [Pistacia vera]